MASIFTYDPDPPRVASPWLSGTGAGETDRSSPDGPVSGRQRPTDTGLASTRDRLNECSKITHLQPEPQKGPIEYKLHLLLRPRRKFKATSTGNYVSGSRHSNASTISPMRTMSESVLDSNARPGVGTPPSASTQQTRQHRLEQLTTQLLWRLQQSSPYHTSSATNIILPSLPEALPELQAPQQPAKLLHGLEESQGALYEIGVSDDGALIGLAEDEMQESLNNLRAMAACLGCTVEILRKEVVGECEWLEEMLVGRKVHPVRRSGKLVVAEALVKPLIRPGSPLSQTKDPARRGHAIDAAQPPSALASLTTEQLRITLTGPTMSGKSTLLGTLTTSTLDNGRGKSRLSMLKHRHEITSGITSSVTQELLGYRDGPGESIEVINYAAENVASWGDIHLASAGSRLVFISDSAGHPRYRRTTLRGLVGWAPHWTLLCIPADDAEDTGGKTGSTNTSQSTLGASIPEMDLSGAQLDLCLRLDLPLVVIITKLDLASRAGLRDSLTKVLDALKTAGRKPAILPNTPGTITAEDLQVVDNKLLDNAYSTALPLLNNPREIVPIVLTSAVDGSGIRNLHALLHELPIPDSTPDDPPTDQTPHEIFDIEDIYNKPAEVAGIIVSGRLRSGHLVVGDTFVIGPFSGPDHDDSEDSDERPSRHKRASPHPPTSRSFPGALRGDDASPFLPLPSLSSSSLRTSHQEWRPVTVVSIRNLRLPVHSLHADQVGSIAIVPAPRDTVPTLVSGSTDGGPGRNASWLSRVRKGMVLASSSSSVTPLATHTFTARFKREDLESLAVGNHVVLYVRSVRASAKVVSARTPDSPVEEFAVGDRGLREELAEPLSTFVLDDFAEHTGGHGDHGGSEGEGRVAGAVTARELLVTFAFDAGREFVTLADRVLVMPGGGPGLYGGNERGEKGVAGLEGFVGEVVEVGR